MTGTIPCRTTSATGSLTAWWRRPFGVIDRRAARSIQVHVPLRSAEVGARARVREACGTESIQFGPVEELVSHAAARVERLRAQGHDDVGIYDATGTSVNRVHAFVLVPGERRDVRPAHGARSAHGLPAPRLDIRAHECGDARGALALLLA